MSDQQSQSFDYGNGADLEDTDYFNAIPDDPVYHLPASPEPQILHEPAPNDSTLYTIGLAEEWDNYVRNYEQSFHEDDTASEPLLPAQQPYDTTSGLLGYEHPPPTSQEHYTGREPLPPALQPNHTNLTQRRSDTARDDYVPVLSAQEPYPEEEAVSLFDIARARDAPASQDRQTGQEPMQSAPPRPVEVGAFGELNNTGPNPGYQGYVHAPAAPILRSPQRQHRHFAGASSSPPPFSEAPTARGRSRRSVASQSTPTLSPSAICQMCVDRAKDKSKARQKKFKPTVYNNGVYCNKHTAQVEKERLADQAPFYALDQAPDADSDAKTTDLVYPMVPPLDYENPSEDDDYLDHVDNESPWVALLTAAANRPYLRPNETNDSQDPDAVADRNRRHDNAVKQQRICNKKPLEASSRDFYNDVTLNSRLRMLFRAILTYHQGGRSLYPVGGSNNGYGDDRTLRFTRRMWIIIEAMEVDKRVVMDVVEGRGVAALAANPRRFADRKNSNNKCNENKLKKLGYMDDSDGEDAGEDAGDDGVDDDDDVEDGGQGPGPSTAASRKRRRM
ncbi:hypothetical protein LTR17_004396 [Elasticomyces elasticus]|nr:hypothetical protein LTR17_004396 [Elasticomyces elasticus]